MAGHTYAHFSQQPMEIIHSGHWLSFEGDNHIAVAQTSLLRWTVVLHRQHQSSALIRQIVKAHYAPVNGHCLSRDSDITAPNPPIAQQPAGHELRSEERRVG